jgi:hypothetical protein
MIACKVPIVSNAARNPVTSVTAAVTEGMNQTLRYTLSS